jgi:hypothetical protein
LAELDVASAARAPAIAQRLADYAELIRTSLDADRRRRKEQAVDPWAGRPARRED